MTKSNKEIRAEQMKYMHVMEEVKPIQHLPGLNVVTRKMAADYFEVPYNTIGSLCYKYKNEMEDYGIIDLKPEDFINAGYKIHIDRDNGTKTVSKDGVEIGLPPRYVCAMADSALFFLALCLRNSPVADKIKEKVWTLEEQELAAQDSVKPETAEASILEDITPEDITEEDITEPAALPELAQKNEIQLFSNPDFGDIRTIVINGAPWFIGKDVAVALGYAKPENAVGSHVDAEDKTTTLIQGTGSNYKSKTIIINESGLYSLILSSKLPTAKKFKRWVTTEVLPSIRKHGAYMTPETLESAILNPDVMIKILQNLKEEQRKNEELNKALNAERERSGELVQTNRALSNDVNTWNHKSILNALIRSYATQRYNNQFQYAFADFYKQLKYKYHVDVKLRKIRSNTNKCLIDYIKPAEIDNALRLAVAICEGAGIDTGKVINTVNAAAYV